MLQLRENLFIKSLVSAFDSLRQNLWFWIQLTIKINIGILLLLSGFFTGVVGLVSCIAQVNPFLYPWNFSIESITSFISLIQEPSSNNIILTNLLGMAFFVLFGALFYGLFSLYFIQVANSYDVAFRKKPRGFVYVKGLMKFLPLLLLMSMQNQLSYESGSSILYGLLIFGWCVFQFYLLFSRLFISIYVCIQEPCSLFKALSKSWHLTASQGLSTVLFALFGLVFQSYMFMSSGQITFQILKMISFLIVYPYYFLVCAHFFYNLTQQK